VNELSDNLYVWKLWDEAHLPVYGSEWAACFDLKASLRVDDIVTVYSTVAGNEKVKRKVSKEEALIIYGGERVLVPTGLVFDLDPNTSLRIHPRSGLALKNGIIVANCEGVVDADYVQQTYVMLYNISGAPFIVTDGDRIAQGEVVPLNQTPIVLADREPGNKTSRSGGFGSTGV
jgi:dUTP pyrophosphatase